MGLLRTDCCHTRSNRNHRNSAENKGTQGNQSLGTYRQGQEYGRYCSSDGIQICRHRPQCRAETLQNRRTADKPLSLDLRSLYLGTLSVSRLSHPELLPEVGDGVTG
jgi:hypothetical protein